LEEKLSSLPEKSTLPPTEPVRPGVTTGAADASVEPEDRPILVRPSNPNRRNRFSLDQTHRWVWVQMVVFGIQLALDLAAIIAGFLLAYAIRKRVDLGGPFIDFNPDNYQLILAISTVSVLVAFYNRGIYRLKRGFSKIDEFYRICAGTLLGLIFAVFFNSFLLGPNFLYSRIIFLYSMVLIIALVSVVRWLFSSLVDLLRRVGLSQVRMVIVGGGDPTARILRKVQAVPQLGYIIAGVVCDNREPGHVCDLPAGAKLLGHLDDLADIVRANEIDELIITMSGVTQEELLNLVGMCDDLPVNIRIYPEAFQLVTTNEVTISALTGLPLVSVKDVALRGINRFIKRGMDIAISLTLLVIVSPLMLLVAILIKLTSPRGPVFYTQERVGLDGKPFTVFKFRSMRFLGDHESPAWTTPGDPRRTRLGRFIRRYSIDELPQFINVLVGDMSIVGPRPEQPHYVEEFSRTIPRYMRRHKEKAGITGWAQVNGLRGDTSIAERTRYDLYYVENWSVLFDLKIMLKTILVIFTDKNAY
jgi:Undecaprenyl-phosphate glucose phosphotransferase